jgi:REP element-mobilizing transposase RayT
MEQDQWHWQEPGTAWKGICVYHITLTVPSREPLLGRLVIPDGDPSQARVERTALGNAVIDELYVMCQHYPAIRIFQFCLMPDHLHAVIRVTRVMDTSIRSVIRGYWQGVKKLGRAHTLAVSGDPSAASSGPSAASSGPSAASGGALAVAHEGPSAASHEGPLAVAPEFNSGTINEGKAAAKGNAASESTAPKEGCWAFPIFTERPFIRPLSRRGQLKAMMRYVQMNPQRLATKRLMPGFFRVQKGIEIAGRSYDGVGNVALLHEECYDVVHVRSVWVKAAERGERKDLRDYMNSRVLKARKGVVMVSPFISPQEKQVMQVLLDEQRSFILLADNGFREYYKPSDNLFDACAEGRLLILSPWQYDAGKRHISRADCMALNAMAEEIAGLSTR